MITSQQVNQMHMASMQMHAMAPGMGEAQPAMGMSQYPPTFSYSMAGYQNPNERMAARMAGAALGGAQATTNTLGTLASVAGIASTAGALMGFGVPAAMGMAGSLPLGLALGAASAGLGAMGSGFQYSGQVNQLLGNQTFANPANPVGRGFSSRDLQTLYGAVRAVDQNDPFVSMQDALRVTQRFGGEFGIQQGIRDADELSRRVSTLGKTLAQMAKTMGTTIDEAGEVMSMSRRAGFYTAADVMGNAQDLMFMRGRGFTPGQFGALQAAGAGMARSFGLSGRAGARFAGGMARDLSLLMESGAVSEQALMDATGATTRNDAAMAFAQMSQGVFQRMSGSGYGQAILAGLMQTDESGNYTGVNRGLLREMGAGGLGASQIRDIGGRNLGTRQGRLTFLNNRDAILGDLMSSDDAMASLLRALETTAEQGGVDAQQLVQQVTGLSSRDYRILKDTVDSLTVNRDERLRQMALEVQTQQRQQFLRENRTFGGLTQRVRGTLSDTLVAPVQDVGARLRMSAAALGEGITGRIFGVARYQTPEQELSRIAAASTAGILSGGDAVAMAALGGDADLFEQIQGPTGASPQEKATLASMAGNTDALKRILEAQGVSAAGLSDRAIAQLRKTAVSIVREGDPKERSRLMESLREDALRFSGQEVESLRGRRLEADAIISQALGDLGLSAVGAGRAVQGLGGVSKRYKTAKEMEVELSSLMKMTSSDITDTIVTGLASRAAFGFLGGIVSEGATRRGQLQTAIAGGAGTALISMAKDAGQMKKIDTIISDAYRKHPGDSKTARESAAKALKAAGITATATDVEIYERVMQTASGNTDVILRAEEKDYSKYSEAQGVAARVADMIAGQGITDVAESQKAFTAVAGAELSSLGVSGSGIGEMLKSAVGATGVTSEATARMSVQSQLVAREAERLRSLQGVRGDVSRQKLFGILGVDPASKLAEQLDSLIGREGVVSKERAMELGLRVGEARLQELQIRGAAGMGAALRSGKTEIQLQAESVQKTAEMIDALYSRVSGSPPLYGDSPIAKSQYDPSSGKWSSMPVVQ